MYCTPTRLVFSSRSVSYTVLCLVLYCTLSMLSRRVTSTSTAVSERTLFFFFFFFHLTIADGPHHYHPTCGHKGSSHLSPVHALQFFYRDASSALLQLVNQWLNFTAFPRFPLRKKDHESYFGKNRTHDFRTSRCAAYLLDHLGDARLHYILYTIKDLTQACEMFQIFVLATDPSPEIKSRERELPYQIALSVSLS